MLRCLKFSLLLAAILVSCNLPVFLEPEKAVNNVSAYNNPHTLCVSCHANEKPQPETALLSLGSDPSSACEDCHEYKQNHHPVDYVPVKPSGSQFPLFNGRVQCLTCHEIHGGPQHEGTPKLLRGGPYADQRKICFKCHASEEYANINPHDMLDNDGKIKEVKGKLVCLLCHSVQPNPFVDKTADVRFRADVGFLCWRCHPPMPGEFFREHFLVTPTKSMQNIREAEERLLVVIPLVPRNRITCSTCHNPHQKGVIQNEASAKGSDARSKLRLPSFCYACHRI